MVMVMVMVMVLMLENTPCPDDADDAEDGDDSDDEANETVDDADDDEAVSVHANSFSKLRLSNLLAASKKSTTSAKSHFEPQLH